MFEESVIDQVQHNAMLASSVLSALAGQSNCHSPSVIISQTQATLGEIEYGGKIFRLNTPVVVSFFVEDALYYCEYASLSILSFGRSRNEAVRSFCEDF